MRPRLGDDEESGGLKLGNHVFSDRTAGSDGVMGGYSRAIQTLRSFGSILAPASAARPPSSGGSARGGGGSSKPHAPYERR